MLSEAFIASTSASNKPNQSLNASLKNAGIFIQEFQPQNRLKSTLQKSTTRPKCLAVAESHVFAAQADKAVINVYNREKGTQEATVPFPEKIHSLVYVAGAAILVLGMQSGKLVLWEIATGRITNSSSSHLEPVDTLCVSENGAIIVSGSADSNVHVWDLYGLVAFQSRTGMLNHTDKAGQTPIRTFSNHRSGITALSCGRSQFSNNFGVSASQDNTCYIWHLETCQVLRTVLLPAAAICIALDPADRAIYLGTDQGSVVGIDLYTRGTNSSLYDHPDRVTVQLTNGDVWRCPSLDHGSTHCLSVVYDGTAILSGHSNGSILRWDVAKKRLTTEITRLNDAVTNLHILKPEGFPLASRQKLAIPIVIKPRLEFNGTLETGTCGVPAKYIFHATAAREAQTTRFTEKNLFSQALRGRDIPPSLLGDAVHAIESQMVGANTSARAADEDTVTREDLQSQIQQLKQQVTVLQNLEHQRRAAKLKRTKKREEIGVDRRKAYFEAKKKGQDGDTAMTEFEEKLAQIDVESDDELLGEGMEIG